MLDGADLAAERLKRLSDQNIHTNYVKFDEEDHVSVLPCMLGRLPRFWIPSRKTNWSFY